METTLNEPAQLLSLFLDGVLGRSGRKQSRRAARYLRGNQGLVSASALLAAAGVAWGIYDSLKAGAAGATGTTGTTGPAGAAGTTGATSAAIGLMTPPPVPPLPTEVLRIVRLAVSAARADGELSPPERALILDHARRAGVEAQVDQELAHPRPLADIVRGVTEPAAQHDLYTLAFAIVRADETVTGGERIYLAQLAHKLGLDATTTTRLETATAAAIDTTQPASDTIAPNR